MKRALLVVSLLLSVHGFAQVIYDGTESTINDFIKFRARIPIKEHVEFNALKVDMEKVDGDSMDLSKNEYANYYYYCAYALITSIIQSEPKFSNLVVAYIDDIRPGSGYHPTTFVLTSGNVKSNITGVAGISYYINKAYNHYTGMDGSYYDAAVVCEEYDSISRPNIFELRNSSGELFYKRGYYDMLPPSWFISHIAQVVAPVSNITTIGTLAGIDENANGLFDPQEATRVDFVYGQSSIKDFANRTNNIGGAILRAQTNTRKKHIEAMNKTLRGE